MVKSQAAGVIFTMHPITMDKSLLVINVAIGLADDLVSGKITPCSVICLKSTGIINIAYFKSDVHIQ